jgi:SAM-dependent methyltransferase
MVPDLLPSTYRCTACGFLASTLPVRINAGSRLDEEVRETALKPLRLRVYQQLLDACADLLPEGARVLDVGCAHGWFLEAARQRGLIPVGLEADKAMAALVRGAGLEVIEGFFPAAVPREEQFDAVTFNDVLEHIPTVSTVVACLRDMIKPGGAVIVNAPMANGLIFRLSRIGARVGAYGPLARMWQEGFPSPHLSYFSPSTLPRLFNNAGFTVVRSGSLESLSTEGLYQRIRYDRKVSRIKAAPLYAAARALRLVAGSFPSDVQYFAFRLDK